MVRGRRSSGRLARRVLLLVSAASLAVMFGVRAPHALAQPPLSVDDAEGDVVYCDTTHPVPLVLLDVRLVEVSQASEREQGWDVTVIVRGFGNLSEEVSQHRDRDPLIDLRLEGSTGRIDVQVGYRDGQLLRRVVDANGADVPGATVLADEAATGDALVTATGLPLGPTPDWGLYTRYTLGDRFACDKAGDSLSADGTPQQPLVATSAPPTTVAATASATPTSTTPTPSTPSARPTVVPPTAPPSGVTVEPTVPASPAGGDVDLPWWLVALLGAGAVIGVGAAVTRRVRASGVRTGAVPGTTTGAADITADMHFSEDPGPHIEMERLPDGGTVVRRRLGDATITITWHPGGPVIQQYPDGATVTINPDGSTVTRTAGGTIFEENPDGTSRTIQPDGTVIEKDRDGSATTTSPDGTVIQRNPSGAIVPPKSPEQVAAERAAARERTRRNLEAILERWRRRHAEELEAQSPQDRELFLLDMLFDAMDRVRELTARIDELDAIIAGTLKAEETEIGASRPPDFSHTTDASPGSYEAEQRQQARRQAIAERKRLEGELDQAWEDAIGAEAELDRMRGRR